MGYINAEEMIVRIYTAKNDFRFTRMMVTKAWLKIYSLIEDTMKQKLQILVLLSLTLIMFSCGGSTDPQKGIINGILALDGQNDHSGITVMLFSGEIIPDKINDTVSQYSQLAFPINDGSFFDHRNVNALSTVLTLANGSFTFPKLNYGKYIIVFFKEGWGYKYIFNVKLDSQNHTLNNNVSKSEVTLKPVIEVPSVISGDYLFQSNRCYNVDGDVVALTGSHLRFQESTKLMMGAGVNITIYGDVGFADGDQLSIVTSSSRIYSSQPGMINRAGGIVYFGTSSSIHNLQLNQLNTGIRVMSDSVNISKMIVLQCGTGIFSNDVSNISISNILAVNNSLDGEVAISNYAVTGATVELCLFYNNYESITNETTTSAHIANCAFIEGNTAFSQSYDSEGIFSNNIIKDNELGILNAGRSNLDISYNTIYSRDCIKTTSLLQAVNTSMNGWTKANFNNLFATRYAIIAQAVFYSDVPFPLDIEQNWWNTTNTGTINNIIWDYNDVGTYGYPGLEYSAVDYIPFRTNAISEAGIQ